MKQMPKTTEVSDGLAELLEARLGNLIHKVSYPRPIEGIQSELDEINMILEEFKRADDLLEALLDDSTTEARRDEICAALKIQHVKVADNRGELERIHAKSHQLLERSRCLIDVATKQTQKPASP